MKLFIDTANLDEIQKAAELGVLDGVTTNPSLISKEKRGDYRGLLREICQIVRHGPVNAEVTATDAPGMLRQAEELRTIAENISIKLPCTIEGVKALVQLSRRGVVTNMTLCFQALQALVVAKAGATYVSPFVGRFDDIAEEGMDLVRTIRKIYDLYGYKTEILAASIRGPLHVVQAALAGADIATVPYAVIEKMLAHPLTDIGLKKFLEDWGKLETPTTKAAEHRAPTREVVVARERGRESGGKEKREKSRSSRKTGIRR